MAFDVGAGFAALGEAVSKTAGAAAIEAQRADLDKEKVLLADQLAAEREEKGRQFTAGENEKQRGWQSNENTANRQNNLDVAKIGLEGHKVSAGATLEAARLSREAQKEEHQKTLDAAVEAAAKIQIGDDGTAYSVNPITKKVEPFKVNGEVLKFRDPDVAKAQVELIKAKTTQLTDISRTYVPQIQALEASIRTIQKNMIPGDKAGMKELEEAQARLKGLQERFDTEKAPIMSELNEYARQFATKGKMTPPPTTGGTRPPLGDLIKIPGQSPPSMINSPPD